jgi:DNA-binding NtrC family response regulator
LPAGVAEASMIGDSEVMRKLRARVVQLAHGRATIRIFGETGTGKGLLARFIAFHAKQKLVHADCITITNQLAGDYLLLDELGELPPEIQRTLLRVLEERKYRRVGGDLAFRPDLWNRIIGHDFTIPREDQPFVDNAPARVADYERSLMSAGLRRAKGKWKTAARTGAR